MLNRWNSRVLIGFSLIYLIALSACNESNHITSTTSPVQKSEELANNLRNSKYVEFYVLNRTGDYNYSPEEFRQSATTRIREYCGVGCAIYLAKFISHLSGASKQECIKGQQNLLIDLDGKSEIIYSYSGRQISFNGECFWNDAGVNAPKTMF
ncbi:MAG: hypothetical protein ACN6RK_11790 [Stenotrophomonas sp.]